jgi:hypothetical protein
MKYTITNITPSIDKETGEQRSDSYGNKRFTVFVTDEQGQIFKFTKGYKNTPNKIGDVLEGKVEQKEGQYGQYWTFTPERKEFRPGYQKTEEDKVPTMVLAYAKDIAVASMNQGKAYTPKMIFDLADQMLQWVEGQKVKTGSQVVAERAVESMTKTIPADEVDLEDIPF